MVEKANMKKRSGLHKDVSSIFDGVPVPNQQSAARPHAGPEQAQEAGLDSPQPPAQTLRNPQNTYSSKQFKQPGKAAGGARVKAGGVISAVGQGLIQQIAKKLFAPKPGVSPARQKVMALLVPVLAVTLIIVFTRVLSVPSKTKGSVTPKPRTPGNSVSTETIWREPEPYPAGLRDPMQLTDEMTAQIEAQAKAEADAKAQALGHGPPNIGATGPQATNAGELTVKGILFSANKPTAVVGARIVHVGDIVAGATIVKINRDTVEFEKDGETWTQAIEP